MNELDKKEYDAQMSKITELTKRKDIGGILKMIKDLKGNLGDRFYCLYCHRNIDEYMVCKMKPPVYLHKAQFSHAPRDKAWFCLREKGELCEYEKKIEHD